MEVTDHWLFAGHILGIYDLRNYCHSLRETKANQSFDKEKSLLL
jgi:hypothetical protein